MPIDVVPVKLNGRGRGPGKFKYLIIQKDFAPVYESFPKHLLADTLEDATAVFQKFSKTINDLARSYAAMSGLSRADLFGEAVIGLARARRDFDPKRSKNFKTFAIFKMKDTLNNYVRNFSNLITVPAYLKRINKWVNMLEDVLKAATLPTEEIEEILNGEKHVSLVGELHSRYLELSTYLSKEAARLNTTQSDLVKRARILPQESSGDVEMLPEDEEEKIQTRIMVEKLRGHLNKTELRIADMIMEGKTYEEIGREFGHTRPWVSQQLVKIKERLKDKFEF